jgi:hypothetical protein
VASREPFYCELPKPRYDGPWIMRYSRFVTNRGKTRPRTLTARGLVMRTRAFRKIRTTICHEEKLNWNPSHSKIHRIWYTWFYIYWGTTLRAISFKLPIFKRKKGFANLSLGLSLYFDPLSQPRSRDTVPLKGLKIVDHFASRLKDLIGIHLYVSSSVTKFPNFDRYAQKESAKIAA